MLAYIQRLFLALTRAERRVFLTALVAGVISGVGFTGTLIQASTEIVPKEGGSYTEGVAGQPAFINPALGSSQVDRTMIKLLFAPLSELAESVETDETSRNVKVRMKEGLRWSDGEEITTDDVIFTIDKIQSPDTNSPFFSDWQGVTLERASKLEVTFHLAAPYAFFTASLDELYILPKHLFAEVPSSNWRLSDYNLQPVGSGPFMFVSYEKRKDGFVTDYHLTRNPDYPGSPALVEKFNVKFFPRENELASAFNGAQVDGFGTATPGILSEVRRTYEITNFPSLTTYAVFWNQSQNLALQEPEVRQALGAAVDRNALVSGPLAGYADPISGPLPSAFTPVFEKYRAQHQEETTEPEQGTDGPALSPRETAEQILEKGGWKKNEGGIREKTIKKTVVPLSFDLTVPDLPALVATGQFLIDAWVPLGVDVSLTVVPPQTLTTDVIRNRDYRALLFGNGVRASGDLFSFWHSSERFFPGLNLSLYHDEKVDGLIEAVRQNPDGTERIADLDLLTRIIEGDYPALFLFSPHYIAITSKDVHGITPRPLEDFSGRFRYVTQWHLKTARVLK